MKKKVNKFKVIIDSVLLLILLFVLTIITAAGISLYQHKDNPIEANVFGYRLQFVETNSMEPTIASNSFILSKRVDIETFDESNLNKIYTYYNIDNDSGEMSTITHKIIDIESEEIAITKGDNNAIIDDYALKPEQVIYETVTPLNFTAVFYDIYSFYKIQLSQNFVAALFLYIILPIIVVAGIIILFVFLIKSRKKKKKSKNKTTETNYFDTNAATNLIDQVDKQWQQQYTANTSTGPPIADNRATKSQGNLATSQNIVSPPPPQVAHLQPKVAAPIPPQYTDAATNTSNTLTYESPQPVVNIRTDEPLKNTVTDINEEAENIDQILAELSELCKESPISSSNPHGMPR